MGERTVFLAGAAYVLGEHEDDYTAISNLPELAQAYKLVANPDLWGWGTIHTTGRDLEQLAAAAGLALGPLLERLFGSVPAVGAALAATGVLLLASGRLRPGRRRIGDLRLGEAFRVGLLQALALAPGLSRSGATIVGGLLLGLEPAEAARFSFLLSLPAVGGAVALHARGLRAGAGAGTIWLGAAVAALVGCWAIGACVARLRRGGLGPFGWYCLVVGTLCVLRGAVSGEWR